MARSEVRHHRKFKRLVQKLDLPVPYVLGLLECLWQTAYESGSPLIGDETDVELAAEWPGRPGVLFRELRELNWIDPKGGRWHVHDLYDWAPEYVKRRIDRRDKKSPYSNDKGLREETANNVGQCRTNGASTQHNTTQHNKEENPSGSSPTASGESQPCPSFDEDVPVVAEPRTTTSSPERPKDQENRGHRQHGSRITTEDIYQAYPRHVEKRAALKAIALALEALRKRPGMTAPESWLLERTLAYSAAREKAVQRDPKERDFTPYPQKWFNRGRYDDKPAEWDEGPKPPSKFHDKSTRYLPG